MNKNILAWLIVIRNFFSAAISIIGIVILINFINGFYEYCSAAGYIEKAGMYLGISILVLFIILFIGMLFYLIGKIFIEMKNDELIRLNSNEQK